MNPRADHSAFDLPARVAVFYGSGDRATFTVDLSDYGAVNGIQMPGMQKKGRISFQINPSYDEDAFTRPPSVQAGPQGLAATGQADFMI